MNLNPISIVNVILVLSWGSPIGLGVMLAGLGVYYWGKSTLDKKKE
jgi:hypothetical protein